MSRPRLKRLLLCLTRCSSMAERYDLSAVGRVKMNMRLALDAEDTQRTLRREDIIACIKALVESA